MINTIQKRSWFRWPVCIALCCAAVWGCSDEDNTKGVVDNPPVDQNPQNPPVDQNPSVDQNPQNPPVDQNPQQQPVDNTNPTRPADGIQPIDNPTPIPGNEQPTDRPPIRPRPDPDKNQSANNPEQETPVYREVNGLMVLPITSIPFTTLQYAHRPNIGNRQYPEAEVRRMISYAELKVTDIDKYETYGLGRETIEGEPWIVREDLLNAADPDLSHKGKSLAYFWQISDPQITDEETPCRMEGINITPFIFGSTYRAQAKYSTHVFDTHLQTAMRISDMSFRPFDFALVTGDIADNAQDNENAWFMRMMEGGVLNPDTGVDDDPIPGPNNDASDPFYTQGIGNIPWYPALGNHDVIYMGSFEYDDTIQAACTGDRVINLFELIPGLDVALPDYMKAFGIGYQDASKVNSDVVTSGSTPADPQRRLLSKSEALQRFYNAPGLPKGHGMDPTIIAKGWGYYSTYPIPGKPLRLITLDTNSGRDSEAAISEEQFKWLGDQIRDAESKNELVIVQSHHGTKKLTGKVNQRTFQSLLASYPGVLLHITGHGHANDSNVYLNYGRGYWELMQASVIDYPSQSRIFEIVYEGKGIISIYVTNVDANVPKGTMVDSAMNYAASRPFFTMKLDAVERWEAEKQHRNMILRTRVTPEITANIERYEWSNVIESETTLKYINKLK